MANTCSSRRSYSRRFSSLRSCGRTRRFWGGGAAEGDEGGDGGGSAAEGDEGGDEGGDGGGKESLGRDLDMSGILGGGPGTEVAAR